MIRTALIGFGYSAQTFHRPFLTRDSRYQLSHIVTSKVDSVKLDFPDASILSTYDEIDPEQVDLVVITTPNHLHFDIASQFLSAGCHVVVEKPFVLSVLQAEELAHLAKAVDRQLVVFQNRRWDGDFLTLQSLLDNNQIGTLKQFTSRFDRFRPVVRNRWREQPGAGAGILWDLGPHLLDQVVALFGQPTSIEAHLSCLRENSEVVDNFELWLDYDHCQVTLGSNCFQAGPNARFQLSGTQGTFVKYGLDVQEEALKRGVDVLDERWGRESEESWGILYEADRSRLITTKPGNYGVFWHQLAECLLNGGESPVPLDDSILVIRLIELAIEANASGQKMRIDQR